MAIERNNNSVKVLNKNVPRQRKDHSKVFSFTKELTFCLPAIAALLCYLNGLHGDFVHDDVFAIKGNQDVFGTSPISSLFKNDYWGKPMKNSNSHKSYRPLTVLTFRLNYELTGTDPYFFHVVNCLLHVIVTCLFTYTCRHVIRLTDTCSLSGAMLFAVHPVHVEAVTGIVGRADLLAAVFYLMSFILYTKCLSSSNVRPSVIHNRLLFILSIVLSTVAMLCKENGVTVLGVCAFYDVGVVCRRELSILYKTRQTSPALKPVVVRLCILFVALVIMIAFRWWIMNGEMPHFQVQDNPASCHSSPLTRWLSFSYIWSYNMWMLLSPSMLCYDWQTGSIPLVQSVLDARNMATVTALVMLVVFIYMSLKNIKAIHKPDCKNIPYICLVFAAISFIPASNIFFRVGFVLAERILYIPSLGYCICIAGGFEALLSRYKRQKRCLIALYTALLVTLAAKTLCQNRVWESRESLFRSGVQTIPHNAKAHYNYANLLKDAGRRDEAIEYYNEALRLDETYAQAHNNLGTLLDYTSEAEGHFLRTLELIPSHQGAHINLGNLYFKDGDHEKGLAYLYKAISLGDSNPDALTSLGTCYVETGNYDGAEIMLSKVLKSNPEFTEAHVSYGGLLSKLGRHAESAEHYQKAYQLDMSHSAVLVNAALQYMKIGDDQQAESLLKQAVSIGADPAAFENLAVLYYHTGRTAESVMIFDEMSQIFPNSTDTAMLKHAKVLANTNNFLRAETLLHNLLRTEPDNIDVLWTLSLLYSKQRKHIEAIQHLNRTIELAEVNELKDLYQLYFDRGDNYKDLKQYDLALNDYQTSLQYNYNVTMTHGNIGVIFHINGDFDKADFHYREALKIEPDNQHVLSNLNKLNRSRGHSVTGNG